MNVAYRQKGFAANSISKEKKEKIKEKLRSMTQEKKEEIREKLGLGNSIVENLFASICKLKRNEKQKCRSNTTPHAPFLSSSNIAALIFEFIDKNNDKLITSNALRNAFLKNGVSKTLADDVTNALYYGIEAVQIGSFDAETKKYIPYKMDEKLTISEFSQAISDYLYFKNTEFTLMDSDNDGLITLNDFEKQYNYNNNAITMITKAFNIDKNKKLNFDEIYPLIPESYEKQSFKLVDINNNGKIDKKEFLTIFYSQTTNSVTKQYAEGFINQVFKYFNIVDGLTFGEFVVVYNLPTNIFSEIEFDMLAGNDKLLNCNELAQYLIGVGFVNNDNDGNNESIKIVKKYGKNDKLSKEQFMKWLIDQGTMSTISSNNANMVNSNMIDNDAQGFAVKNSNNNDAQGFALQNMNIYDNKLNEISNKLEMYENRNKLHDIIGLSIGVGILLMLFIIMSKLFCFKSKKKYSTKKYNVIDTSDSDLESN